MYFEHVLIVPGSWRFGLLGKVVVALRFSQAEGEAWLKHAIEEMGVLEHFLPQLYEREAQAEQAEDRPPPGNFQRTLEKQEE
jgi:hypothetical protein